MINQNIADALRVGADLAEVLGIPVGCWAVWSWVVEQRREARDRDQKLYLDLNEAYQLFLDRMLENPDIWTETKIGNNVERETRRRILYEKLIAVFEQAFLLLFFEDKPSEEIIRLQASWTDFMRFWATRDDFRQMLPILLEGEDPDFAAYLTGVCEGKSGRSNMT